jgi:multidrug efflux system membrane fusion protein
MPVEIRVIGAVEALNTVIIRSQVTGVLTRTHFREGDAVKAGDLLFDIDDRPFQQAVRQAESTLARDRALLLQVEADLIRAQAEEDHSIKQRERYDKLAAEGIISKEVADQTSMEARRRRAHVQSDTAAVESARASVRASEATLENARLNLEYCAIRSPISGRTGSLPLKIGNLVKANDVDLVTIHQIQPAQVTFAVPEHELSRLRSRVRSGTMAVSASIPNDSGDALSGKISFLDNAVDSGTGTIRLKATFPNSESRLWPGQFVNVRIVLEELPNAMVVPASAVQTGQNGSFVYVVQSDNTVAMRAVEVGASAEREVAIEGVKAGERVVIEGQLRIAPGAKVRITT